MRELSPCGSGGCMSCPYSSNEETEIIHNYGCLPTPKDIMELKVTTGHNWSCHNDETKVCSGFATDLKQKHPDLSVKNGGLISYEVWYQEGEEMAIEKAGIQEMERKEKVNI